MKYIELAFWAVVIAILLAVLFILVAVTFPFKVIYRILVPRKFTDTEIQIAFSQYREKLISEEKYEEIADVDKILAGDKVLLKKYKIIKKAIRNPEFAYDLENTDDFADNVMQNLIAYKFIVKRR